jgi:hypothetical protein
MADIVQQLPVLTGVVIGALASYLASSATERARWRRQQAARWDDKRAQIYADYGYTVKNVYIACLRIVENRGPNTKSIPTDPQVFGEFERLAAERTAKWESVLLLGNPETIAAARAWHRSIWQMEVIARGIRTDETAWTALLDKVDDARTRFYEAARRDLGITSGRVPHADRWEGRIPRMGSGEGSSEASSEAT